MSLWMELPSGPVLSPFCRSNAARAPTGDLPGARRRLAAPLGGGGGWLWVLMGSSEDIGSFTTAAGL